MKLLLVDDSPANRLVLAALLRRAGHEAVAAQSAAEARRIFDEISPDAVLTDLNLSAGEDGISLAKALRERAGGRIVRIALITGDAPAEANRDGLFDAVIEKPVSIDDIRAFLGEEK